MEGAAVEEEALTPQWKEQVLIDCSRRMLTAFSVTGDEETAFAWVADDVEWVGPFSWQLGNLAQIKKMFYPDKGDLTVSFSDEIWRAKRAGGVWLVTGSYLLTMNTPAPRDVLRFRLRATLVWARQPAGPRIVYFHVSHAMDESDVARQLSEDDEEIFEFLREQYGEARNAANKLEIRDIAGCTHFLSESEILYVRSDGPHCYAKVAQDEFALRGPLKKLEEQLSDRFVRTHRSYLVNVERVMKIDRESVLLDDGSTCPLATRRYRAVRLRVIDSYIERRFPDV